MANCRIVMQKLDITEKMETICKLHFKHQYYLHLPMQASSKAEEYILATKELANSRIIHALRHLAPLTTTSVPPLLQNRSQATRMRDHVIHCGTRPQEMETPVEGGQGEAARSKKKEDYKTRWVQRRCVPTGWLGTARSTPATPS